MKRTRSIVIVVLLLILYFFGSAHAQEQLPWVFEEVAKQGGTWTCVPIGDEAAPDDGYYAVFEGVSKGVIVSLASESGYPSTSVYGRFDEKPTIKVDFCPPPPDGVGVEIPQLHGIPEFTWSMNILLWVLGILGLAGLAFPKTRKATAVALVIVLAIALIALAV